MPPRGAREIDGGAACAAGNDRNAEPCLQQRREVGLTGDFVLVREIDIAAAQRIPELLAILAVGAHDQAFLAKIFDVDAGAVGKGMLLGHRRQKGFGEQRPAVEPLPGLADRTRNPELRFTLLEVFAPPRRRSRAGA